MNIDSGSLYMSRFSRWLPLLFAVVSLAITAIFAWQNNQMSVTILIVGTVLTGLLTWGIWSVQKIKAKSDALQEATKTLMGVRKALDSSVIVSMADMRGKITYVNDNFCKISKYAREELLGQNHRIIKSGLHPGEYYVDLWQTITSGKVWTGEICNQAKDRSHYWLYSTIFAFAKEEGRPVSYMNISHDITARKAAEAALAERSDDLQRSNQALEEFDHIVAHELKTPLTVIKMAAENLTGCGLGDLNPAQKHIVDIINKNVDQITITINSLLSLAQLHASEEYLTVRNINGERHIGKVLQNFQVIAQKKNIRISSDIPEDLPPLRCSPEVFSEVLTNLVGNAIRYASHGIVVRAGALPGWVQVEVQDDGPGIPKEQLATLFKKFASDNKPQGPLFHGSGLGLYICKELLSRMGGKIWVESDTSKGSCFYFVLPQGTRESLTSDASSPQ